MAKKTNLFVKQQHLVSSVLADIPVFEPWQIAGTFTLDSSERLAKFMIWKPLQLLVSHGPEAHHRVRPERLSILWNLPEDLTAVRC